MGTEIPGLSCLVEGTIPPSAGLSSSSGVLMIICFSIEMDKSQVLYLDDFMILAKNGGPGLLQNDFVTYAKKIFATFAKKIFATFAKRFCDFCAKIV